jgi:hypothetical protein
MCQWITENAVELAAQKLSQFQVFACVGVPGRSRSSSSAPARESSSYGWSNQPRIEQSARGSSVSFTPSSARQCHRRTAATYRGSESERRERKRLGIGVAWFSDEKRGRGRGKDKADARPPHASRAQAAQSSCVERHALVAPSRVDRHASDFEPFRFFLFILANSTISFGRLLADGP